MKKRVDIIMEKFEKSKKKRQQKDSVWKELDAFDRNDQWNLNDAPPWLPKPVTNYIHLVKYTKRAAFAVDNPTGKLRPMSPAGQEPVRMLNKAYEDTADRIKMRKTVRENIETSKLLGTAIAQMYWNEHTEGRMGTTILGDEGFQYEGEIGLREIQPTSFYPDPNAFTIEDCEYIFIRERKPLEWIKKNPKFSGSWSKEEESDAVDNKEDRGEVFIRDYDTAQSGGLITFTTFYEKEMNDEGGFSYYVTYLAGEKILLDKEPLRPNRYPFAILYDFKQRHDFWAMSTCQFILDNQKIINKVESIITMIGTLMQNPQKVVTKTSNIDPREVARYGSAPNQTWHTDDVDPSRSIYHIQPPQIPTVLFNLLEQAKQNIREITGLTESYMGQNVGSLQTSSGVQALIDRATMRDRDQMYDIELYLEDLTHLTIDFMTTYYEEQRMIRIMGEREDDFEFVPFTGVEYRDLAYDVAVDVSSKAPLTRMKEMNDAKELLNLQGQYGQQYGIQVIKPQEAIRMMHLSNSEALIERMDMEEMQNKVQEAMQVAQMIAEAQQQGVPQEEVMQMAESMFQQMGQATPAGGVQPNQGFQDSYNPQNTPQGS